MGTDSAPHETRHKENECGCAGVFNTINSIQIITQLFENHNKIHLLENFLSKNGPLHYELPINSQKINLLKRDKPIYFPEFMTKKNFKIKIFKPNFDVYWQIESDTIKHEK